jgi:hypothetical protein
MVLILPALCKTNLFSSILLAAHRLTSTWPKLTLCLTNIQIINLQVNLCILRTNMSLSLYLSLWNRIVLEKTTVAWPNSKFPAQWLRNPVVHCRVHSHPPLGSVLNLLVWVSTFTPQPCKLHFNVIFQVTLRISNWTLPLKFRGENFAYISRFPCACYVVCTSHLPRFLHPSNSLSDEESKLWNSSLYTCLQSFVNFFPYIRNLSWLIFSHF